MAAKSKIEYQCGQCGALSPKWVGQCGECGEWNTLIERISESVTAGNVRQFSGYAGHAKRDQVQRLSDIKPESVQRYSLTIDEFDRVLGGGLVEGSVVLIGGDPGIGKSTLLLQCVALVSGQLDALYVTGEESLDQVSLRAQRLGLNTMDMQVLSETSVEKIIDTALQEKPRVMVIDSIQTIYTDNLSSAPGSVGQVRESAAQLVRFAKQTGCALFLVGHVTKEGTLAGPRVLEHMVDTVLYFEGDPSDRYRIIRAIKNRFGAVNELGIFAMLEDGLKPVSNPSAIFLSRHEQAVTGSVIMASREGSRTLLLEVQALVADNHGGSARRVTVGQDTNRIAMLLGILQRHGGLALYDQDVFINIVGGMKVIETASDLAVIVAMVSSFRDKPFPSDTVVFGEVGLAGEIRPVPNGEQRLQEAAKHGFKRVLLPKANLPRKSGIKDIEMVPLQKLEDVLEYC
ncbi:MAG: DNA repair protein RadA [Gammaproteobacteria bacterium]|nr:DNA repair protein RadA [Gammaproteobacteria bacterium]